jgi:aspartate racemase
LLNRVIRELGDHGCDAVALACTEIPLLISPADSPLPILDSTRILARAALREATAAENEIRNDSRG